LHKQKGILIANAYRKRGRDCAKQSSRVVGAGERMH